MNYYFMPRVAGLSGAVTLANFPPAADDPIRTPKQTAHVAWSDGRRWHIRSLNVLEPGVTATYLERDLPPDFPADATPFFTLHPSELPRTAERLPVSNHLDSTPMWRANIQLRSPSTSVGYQGEYPRQMLGIERGALLSLATMARAGAGIAPISCSLICASIRLSRRPISSSLPAVPVACSSAARCGPIGFPSSAWTTSNRRKGK